MRILALESFYGGSHKAFIDGWMANSEHQFKLLSYPATKWKWRMRHSAASFAEEINQLDESFDLIFCTDMINLAELRGLLSPSLIDLPVVLYMHENQLTYPDPTATERDYHFAFTNIVSCLAADEIWFNSGYHRDVFIAAVGEFLQRMPDRQLRHAPERIADCSRVEYPGVDEPAASDERTPGPVKILWAARWEHDKAPGLLFDGMRLLAQGNLDFRLNVVGQTFENQPEIFEKARTEFADRIDQWGFVESREAYLHLLAACDLVVSTAAHEFFGIAVVEAIAAGCYPVLPNRLAYPEIAARLLPEGPQEVLYEGTPEALAARIFDLSSQSPPPWQDSERTGILRSRASAFFWTHRAKEMDARLRQLV